MEYHDFSKIFHQSSKDPSRGHPPVSGDDAEWPEEWKTVYYKTYPRLPQITLDGNPPKADLFDVVRNRASRRDFARHPLSFEELSSLLKYSCGITGKLDDDRHRRAYPSGGARFPIEAYVLVLRGAEKIPAGLYHYNVLDHALDVMWEKEFGDEEVAELFSYPWMKEASAAIVLTAVFSRTQSKYGERGYRMILEEAGHIGQNIYLIAEALKMKCVALAGTRDLRLEELFDIDGVTESVVYGFALGK